MLVATLPPDWRRRWGELRPRGMGMAGQPAHAELFHRGALLPLARWPDAGMALVAATPDGKQGQRLVAADPLPPGLAAEPDLWAFGFWGADWAPSHLPVQALDEATGTVTLPARGIRYGIREGAPFQLENALAVLDQPGEWYLDRTAGRLFVWPPAELAPGDLELSLTETLLELTDAADVTVTGLGFAAARGDAVVIAGGSGNRLADCSIRNIGNVAVRLGGSDSEVTDCTIADIGDSAVVLDGGDRPSLTPGRLALTNSHIHDYGRWTRAYTAGAMLHGVGNRVAGNIIGRAPHMGIQIHGNDHVVEGNLLHDLVRATNDAGAIYIWGDWAQRGHVIRDNTICRVNAPTRFAIGIYLDLFASGIVIEGNRLFDVHWGILLNGGSDNLVRGNIVVGGEYPIRFDAIGLSWSRAPVLDPNSHLRRPLAQLPIDGPLWRSRYPGLATVLEGDPGMPKRNVFAGNRIYGSAMVRFDTKAAAHTTLEGNTHAPQASAADLQHWFPALCRA